MKSRLSSEDVNVLEKMLDKGSLELVLEALSEILLEKSEHVRLNYGEFKLAKRLTKAALRINRVASSFKEEEAF